MSMLPTTLPESGSTLSIRVKLQSVAQRNAPSHIKPSGLGNDEGKLVTTSPVAA